MADGVIGGRGLPEAIGDRSKDLLRGLLEEGAEAGVRIHHRDPVVFDEVAGEVLLVST
jgi:hypothetical protein